MPQLVKIFRGSSPGGSQGPKNGPTARTDPVPKEEIFPVEGRERALSFKWLPNPTRGTSAANIL